jgi:hypothetical protein
MGKINSFKLKNDRNKTLAEKELLEVVFNIVSKSHTKAMQSLLHTL